MRERDRGAAKIINANLYTSREKELVKDHRESLKKVQDLSIIKIIKMVRTSVKRKRLQVNKNPCKHLCF